jgi:hypothetical protein
MSPLEKLYLKQELYRELFDMIRQVDNMTNHGEPGIREFKLLLELKLDRIAIEIAAE